MNGLQPHVLGTGDRFLARGWSRPCGTCDGRCRALRHSRGARPDRHAFRGRRALLRHVLLLRPRTDRRSRGRPTTTIPSRSASSCPWRGPCSACSWACGWPRSSPGPTLPSMPPGPASDGCARRIRPGVIFGFGGNALIATSFHVVQRTSRARLAGQISPWFVLLGYNLFCVLAVSGYLLGVTQSKEYAEAGVVRRPLAGDRVGDLLPPLHRHDRAPERAAHLRRQLVLHGLHPGRGDPAHRQQPGASRVDGGMPRATRSGRACRTRWCSGGTATTPSPSS